MANYSVSGKAKENEHFFFIFCYGSVQDNAIVQIHINAMAEWKESKDIRW